MIDGLKPHAAGRTVSVVRPDQSNPSIHARRVYRRGHTILTARQVLSQSHRGTERCCSQMPGTVTACHTTAGRR